jgi:hypothetical protein
MPLQNRVTPLSELISDPARGLVYGNRGCLHDDAGRIRRHHNGRRWIACRLRFKDWHRGPLLQPGKFTELFFLDEATAFSAGHRPCALCRREDYVRFLEIVDAPGADAIDARLHAERFSHHEDDDLPDGAMVLRDSVPWLVRGRELLRWTPAGYTDRVQRPRGAATVITPPSLVGVLRSGWDGAAVPLMHETSEPAAGLAQDPEL